MFLNKVLYVFEKLGFKFADIIYTKFALRTVKNLKWELKLEIIKNSPDIEQKLNCPILMVERTGL